MPTYSVWMLEAANVAVSGGGSLSGITQGDGSHLRGRTITLLNRDVIETRIRDNDTTFDDNDTSQQVLDGAQTIGGTSYRDGTRVEAEYRLVLEDPATGSRYTVYGYNVNNSSPAYGTIEGLAFLGPRGAWPPAGVALRVVQTGEGPGDFGIPPVGYDDLVVPCFTPGVRIRCPGGPRRIETIAPGEPVCVRGAGPQPVARVLRSSLSLRAARARPDLAPIVIRAHAFGPGRPVRDLAVSPQHRLLIRSPRAQLLFGEPEVLVAAGHLVNGTTIRRAPPARVTYLHLVLDAHRIVWAEGLETESLLPAFACNPGAPPALRAELMALFPDLAAAPARPVLRTLRDFEARALAA